LGDPRVDASWIAGRGFMPNPRRRGSEWKRAVEERSQFPLQVDCAFLKMVLFHFVWVIEWVKYTEMASLPSDF